MSSGIHVRSSWLALRFAPAGKEGGLSPDLPRDHFHADAMALTYVIFDRLKAEFLQQSIEPLAPEHMIMGQFSPIGIDLIGMEQVPGHRIHVRQGEQQDPIVA